MKKSRIFLSVLTVMLLLTALLVLSACEKQGDTCQHQWGEFETACEPTCTTEGVRVRFCAICGRADTETIAVAEHAYVGVVTEPTCTSAGFTTHTCVCGHTYKDAETPKKGHAYSSTVTSPTCTSTGFTTHVCADCGHTYTDSTVAKLPHAYNASSAVTAPTCEEKGYTTHTCVCGETKVDTYVSALGHQLSDWQDDSTCVCERTDCGETVTATRGLMFLLQTDDTYHVVGLDNDTATAVIIPGKFNGKAVSGIATRAFFGKTTITSVDIPASVTTIGEDAFFACAVLESIRVNSDNAAYYTEQDSLVERATNTLLLARGEHIPQGVTTIAKYAFAYSTAEQVCLPASVTTVAQNAFYRAARLTRITVDPENTVFTASGNCLIETATKTLVLGCKGSVIPTDGSVEIIGSYAFAYIRALTGLSIPDSVTAIRPNAFVGCLLLIEEADGGYYVGNWLVDCDEGTSALILRTTIRGFADDALNGCDDLSIIYYNAEADTWENSVKRFDGWDISITIVCDDAQIVNGVRKSVDDTETDIFDPLP